VDYIKFLRLFPDRIYNVHMKDVWWGRGDGTVGVFGGHTSFGDARRFWDFRSVGRGMIDFESIIVALNDIAYQGPLSVEWEDSRMDRDSRRYRERSFLQAAGFQTGRRRV
jgi:sugar phosphate isomerase/epimerase